MTRLGRFRGAPGAKSRQRAAAAAEGEDRPPLPLGCEFLTLSVPRSSPGGPETRLGVDFSAWSTWSSSGELLLAAGALRSSAPGAGVLLRPADRRQGLEGVPLRDRRLRSRRDARLRRAGRCRRHRRPPEHRGCRGGRDELSRLLARGAGREERPTRRAAPAHRAHREELGARALRRTQRRQVLEPAAQGRSDAVRRLRRAVGRPDRRRTGRQAHRAGLPHRRRGVDRRSARHHADRRTATLEGPAGDARPRAVAAPTRRTCGRAVAGGGRLPHDPSARLALFGCLCRRHHPESPEGGRPLPLPARRRVRHATAPGRRLPTRCRSRRHPRQLVADAHRADVHERRRLGYVSLTQP